MCNWLRAIKTAGDSKPPYPNIPRLTKKPQLVDCWQLSQFVASILFQALESTSFAERVVWLLRHRRGLFAYGVVCDRMRSSASAGYGQDHNERIEQSNHQDLHSDTDILHRSVRNCLCAASMLQQHNWRLRPDIQKNFSKLQQQWFLQNYTVAQPG